ncbi:MAG: IS110 family transposase [Solirubrobacterales bacterium]|nr:IS110 family transposase [Solirubrobacterales bacterium]
MSDGRFAGVDWASEEHAVCVVDERGRIAEGRRYGHNEPGIRALCGRLVRLQVRLVAVERPDGLLIERLLDAGLSVAAVHPNQVKASRPRYSVAGGKSDGFDSFVLAELARTDSHRFRVLVPDSDQTKALRAMTRARESLVRTRVGLANQLRDQLACFWPGASKVFSSVDSQIALAFLRRYPTPVDARGLGEQRLAAFLKRHGYPGRKPARELLARLRNGAEGRAGELELVARRQIVLALVSALEPIVARISELTIEIRHALRAHPDGPTFRSLFIDPDSWLCAASMLAEIGDCRERYPTYRALAADAGQCPVAVESGKAKHAQFRWACDHRLRDAFDKLADSSRRHNPWAADIYNRATARGASHAHAVRILGRSWCQIIWRLWHDHDTYDPNRHTARQRFIASSS